MRYHQVIMFAFAFFAVVASLGAQSTISGYVTGVVSDPSNAVVNNASVTLKNSDTSFTQSAKSGSDGVFHFEYVPPGNYKLSVTASGFSTAEQTMILEDTPTLVLPDTPTLVLEAAIDPEVIA